MRQIQIIYQKFIKITKYKSFTFNTYFDVFFSAVKILVHLKFVHNSVTKFPM
jgi:hypothetical protein